MRSLLQSDLRIKEQAREIKALQRDLRHAKAMLSAARDAGALLPFDYARALADVHHLGTHALVSSDENIGGPSAFASRAPAYDPTALRRYQAEERALEARAVRLDDWLADALKGVQRIDPIGA